MDEKLNSLYHAAFGSLWYDTDIQEYGVVSSVEALEKLGSVDVATRADAFLLLSFSEMMGAAHFESVDSLREYIHKMDGIDYDYQFKFHFDGATDD